MKLAHAFILFNFVVVTASGLLGIFGFVLMPVHGMEWVLDDWLARLPALWMAKGSLRLEVMNSKPRCNSWSNWVTVDASYYNDAIWCLKSSATPLFVQHSTQTNSMETPRLCTTSPISYGGIQQRTVDSPHKGPIIWNTFPCHNVIMETIRSVNIVGPWSESISWFRRSSGLKHDAFSGDNSCMRLSMKWLSEIKQTFGHWISRAIYNSLVKWTKDIYFAANTSAANVRRIFI